MLIEIRIKGIELNHFLPKSVPETLLLKIITVIIIKITLHSKERKTKAVTI